MPENRDGESGRHPALVGAVSGRVIDNPVGLVKDGANQICRLNGLRLLDHFEASFDRQLAGFLAAAGTNKTKLLSANIWITDMANFAEMNAVWDAWVSPGNTPARATVEAKLASPDYKVEIMVVAAR